MPPGDYQPEGGAASKDFGHKALVRQDRRTVAGEKD
jgi:hypothetical protein